MQRHMDLARAILFELEKAPYVHGWHDIGVDGYSAAEIGYHIELLSQAGFITAIDLSTMGSPYPDWRAKTITWEGHEFLDSARDETRWERAKVLVKDKGMALTLETAKLALSELIRKHF